MLLVSFLEAINSFLSVDEIVIATPINCKENQMKKLFKTLITVTLINRLENTIETKDIPEH